MGKVADILTSHLFDPHAVFVFPSEIAAASWMEYVVEEVSPAVREDRFISWDTCMQQLARLGEGWQSADTISRRLFATLFLESNSSSRLLHRLIPSEHADVPALFVTSLASILPEILILTAPETAAAFPVLEKDDPAVGELRILAHAYREFLTASRLYEPLLMRRETLNRCRLHSGDTAAAGEYRYVVCYPELIPELAGLQPGSDTLPACFELVAGEAHPLPELLQFRHIGFELEALFTELERRLQAGTDPERMAVTLGNYDQLVDEIERGAELRSIPLKPRGAKAITRYPAARFFGDLLRVSNEEFSLESLKKLLLNRGYPWLERESGRELVSFGIEHGCIRNSNESGNRYDIWERTLKRNGREELLDFYLRLSGSVRKIASADTADLCYREFMQFWNSFLNVEGWGSGGAPPAAESESQKVVSYCLDHLSRFTELCGRCPPASEAMTGMPARFPNIYAFWVAGLESLRYVPQYTEGAVSLYPYGVSAGIVPEFHAVIGMNSQATSRSRGVLPLLPERMQEIIAADEREEAEAYLHAYAGSGNSVAFSCAQRDYSGAQLPNGLFVAGKLLSQADLPISGDSWNREQLFWEDPDAHEYPGAIYPLQKRGFAQAAATFLKGPQELILTEPLADEEIRRLAADQLTATTDGKVRLSPTSVDTFLQCPANWYFTRILKLEEREFSIAYDDPLLTGRLIHAVLAGFYHAVSRMTGSFSAEMQDRYQTAMKLIIDREMRSLGHAAQTPLQPVAEWMHHFLLQHLPKIIAADADQFEGWESRMLERFLERERHSGDMHYAIGGQIDRVAVSPESGVMAVIDYKKQFRFTRKSFTEAERIPDSLQLPMYAWLLETERAEDRPVSLQACYYSVTEGKYIVIGTPENTGNFRRLVDLSLELCDDMISRIATGDFTAIPTRERCSECRNRSVCRGRYVIR